MMFVIHNTSWYIWHPKIGLFQTVKLSDLEKIICQDVTSAWHLWFQGCERQQADWWRTCGNKWYQQPETADFSRENMVLTTKHVLGRNSYESKPWYSGEHQTIPPTIWYCTGFDPCRNSTPPYCPKMKYVQKGCDCSDQDANNQKRGVNSSKCDLTIQTILMIRLTHKTDMRIEPSIQVWFCPWHVVLAHIVTNFSHPSQCWNTWMATPDFLASWISWLFMYYVGSSSMTTHKNVL